ncbi:hypothetical protein F4815DRAFT_289954 [Daldinia loculata]|nr:hypothetical protein F4815DRAFT_289954 [Daldinia loculata]
MVICIPYIPFHRPLTIFNLESKSYACSHRIELQRRNLSRDSSIRASVAISAHGNLEIWKSARIQGRCRADQTKSSKAPNQSRSPDAVLHDWKINLSCVSCVMDPSPYCVRLPSSRQFVLGRLPALHLTLEPICYAEHTFLFHPPINPSWGLGRGAEQAINGRRHTIVRKPPTDRSRDQKNKTRRQQTIKKMAMSKCSNKRDMA